MEFTSSAGLLAQLQQNRIGARDAIRRSQLLHHTPLLGWRRMWNQEDIGILYVGTNGKTESQEF